MHLAEKLGSGAQILRANLQDSYRAPFSVYLSLTDRCPNRCKYCNYYNLDDEDKELKTPQILRLIDEMSSLHTRRFQLTGGEPMVRNDIGKIINYARSRGLFVGVSTSGLLIPKKINELKNVNIVFLSLDGDEKAHDSLRGEGTYRMVMEAMDTLKANNIKFFTTTVLTRENRDSIDHILRMAREKGFWSNYVFLYHEDDAINNMPSSEKLEELMLTDKEVRETAAYLLDRKSGGEPVGSSAEYLNFLINWKDFSKTYSPQKVKNIKCWAGRLSCHINAKGKLYGCGVAMGMVEGQDVTELGLQEAFIRSSRVPDCNSCIQACWLESNIIYSLNMGAIWNWLRALNN